MTRLAPIRAGVIGVGIMGERHARLYARLPGAELAGVYDADAGRAAAVAARWGARAHGSVEGLLDAVDVVSIAASTQAHAALAALALDRGVHLLVEKPLADSLASARQLAARAAARPATTVQVGHIERFNPVVRALQRLLRGQPILAMTMERLSPFDGRCLDSDVIHDLMIHDLDLAVAFCGDRLEVLRASGGSPLGSRIDHASAHLRAPDGARLTLRASRVARRKVRAITVVTEEAWIEADLLNKTIARTRRAGRRGFARVGAAERIGVPDDEPLRLELQSFLDCVRRGARPVVGVAAGLSALSYAAAIGERIAAPERAPVSGLVLSGELLAAGA